MVGTLPMRRLICTSRTLGSPACQHAKCILVDGVTAFITSANFTESAHERNIELGVLFRENPKVAQSIRSKFESLIQNGFLKPLPKC
jgi:phosphatidylserine/phosphatidylglycerophosphate/cardiolipin synthase-like enzyme